MRNMLLRGTPSLATLLRIADATEVRAEWLATGEGPMRPGEAPQAPAAEPSQAQHGISDGARVYTGVKAAVCLVMAALGDQAPHIGPARLADLIDAAHQALQSGIDPALVTRLIAASSGRDVVD